MFYPIPDLAAARLVKTVSISAHVLKSDGNKFASQTLFCSVEFVPIQNYGKITVFNYTRYLFGETAKRVFLVALACAIIGMTSHLVNEKIYRSLTEKYGLMSDRYVLAKI